MRINLLIKFAVLHADFIQVSICFEHLSAYLSKNGVFIYHACNIEMIYDLRVLLFSLSSASKLNNVNRSFPIDDSQFHLFGRYLRSLYRLVLMPGLN